MKAPVKEVIVMNTTRLCKLMLAFLLLVAAPMSVADTIKTFQGTGNDYNLGFSVDGHWELHWQVEGNKDFPSFSQFEVRLEDALSGRFLGVFAQKTGSGQGVRYVTDGGRFLVHVLAKNVRWKLDVVDVEEPWANVPELKDTKEAYRTKVIVADKIDGLESGVPEGEDDEEDPK